MNNRHPISKTTKQLKNYIRKLRVTHNSVIMILAKDENDQDAKDLATSLADAIEETDLQHVVVMLIDSFDRIASMDINAMNKLGWFRREQIVDLFKKIKEPENA